MTTVNETKESAAFDCLVVTQVQVFPFEDNFPNSLKGFANIVLNDQLLLRGLRINGSSDGLWVVFPADPFYKGDGCRSLVFPMTKQLREHIENCVLEKYQAAIA
jgi:stage V sporulation protein G